MLLLGILTLALAEPCLRVSTGRVLRIYLLDVSGSTREFHSAYDALVRQDVGLLSEDDRVGLIVFARESVVLSPAVSPSQFGRYDLSKIALDRNGTNIEDALLLARSYLIPGFSPQMILISDGNETTGDAMRAAYTLDAPVFVRVLASDNVADVRVEHFDPPQRVPSGIPFELPVTVATTTDCEVRVEMRRWRIGVRGTSGFEVRADTDRKVSSITTHLLEDRPARVVFEDILDEGVHEYEVRVIACEFVDAIPENDRLSAPIEVAGPPRILCITTDTEGSAVARFLRTSPSLLVDVVDSMNAVSEGPIVYDAVVMDNFPLFGVERRAQAAMEALVRDWGAGLFVVGGKHSYGPGGYRGGEIEATMPVWCTQRKERLLVFVLDRSASMALEVGGARKIDLAKEAVIGLCDKLGEDDTVVAIAFSAAPQIILEATSARERTAIWRGISAVKAEGSTSIIPALEAALSEARKSAAERKHILLLSDGRSEPHEEKEEEFVRMAEEFLRHEISISVVVTGTDVEEEKMRLLTAGGKNGRCYKIEDFRKLEEVFHSDWEKAQSEIFEENIAIRRTGQAGPLTGLDNIPLIGGYVKTYLKDRAEAFLVAEDGAPILAGWEYGAGRVLALATSADGWNGCWQGWELLGDFLARCTTWVLRTMGQHELEVKLEERCGKDIVKVMWKGKGPTEYDDTVHATAPDNGVVKLPETLKARIFRHGEETREVELKRSGVSVYEGDAGTLEEGSYFITVIDPASNSALARDTATIARKEEWQRLTPNLSLLRDIAGVTGGQVVDRLDDVPLRGVAGEEYRSMRWVMLAIFLALFVGEMILGLFARRGG